MSKQNIPQDEEIDLGSLFKIIGKGFSNLFNAVGNFFKGILHYIIANIPKKPCLKIRLSRFCRCCYWPLFRSYQAQIIFFNNDC